MAAGAALRPHSVRGIGQSWRLRGHLRKILATFRLRGDKPAFSLRETFAELVRALPRAALPGAVRQAMCSRQGVRACLCLARLRARLSPGHLSDAARPSPCALRAGDLPGRTLAQINLVGLLGQGVAFMLRSTPARPRARTAICTLTHASSVPWGYAS
jgi:hypothetical protein